MLSASSPCDNVLLEYMLALELQMRGLIVNIYPVMIGDIKPGVDHLFGNYFKDGCHPSLGSDEVFVKNNQSALEGHLDRLGLGTPMLDDLSVSKTLKEITKNQGLFVEGSIRTCLQRLAAHVSDMRKDIDAMITNAAVEAKIQSEKDLNSRRRSSLLLTSILSTGVASSAGTSVLAALTTDTAKPSAPSPSLSPSPSPSQSPAPTSVPQVEVAFPDVYSIAVVPEQVTYEVNPSLQSKTTKPPKENNTTEGNMPEPVTENPEIFAVHK